MGTAIFYGCLWFRPRLKLRVVRIMGSSELRSVGTSEPSVFRLKVLEQVDRKLEKGDEREALSLVKDLQGKPGGLRCFGAARQVPQRLYTLDELKLNGIDTLSLLSPVDVTLGSIERNLQIAAIIGGFSSWAFLGFNPQQLLLLLLGLLFLGSVDSIAFNGGVGNLLLDTIGHALSQKYRNRVVQPLECVTCSMEADGFLFSDLPVNTGVLLFDFPVSTYVTIQHEAGHFLIAYLLGVLPRGYAITSLEALRKEGSLNVQAGTAFVDFKFLEEVNTGKLSAKMLNQFTCIALAGVATEYLLFGCSEGGLADIYKLDNLLKSLGFTQKKADSQVRWAVLNTILILRRQERARSRLAEAMSLGKSVGFCIDTIEEAIDFTEI